MIIGIICFIMTTLMPELDYQSLENIIYIIMAYIFAEAGIDAVAVHRKMGGIKMALPLVAGLAGVAGGSLLGGALLGKKNIPLTIKHLSTLMHPL